MTARQGDDRRRDRGPVAFPLAEGSGIVPAERRRADRRRSRLNVHVALLLATDSAEVDAILADCPVRECAAEEILLRPGEHNALLYLVLAGSLAVKLDPHDPDPVHIGPGDCVGEMSIIDGEPVSAYVVAAAGTRLLVVDDTLFWQRLVPLPGVARNLMRAQTRRMRTTNQAILAKQHRQLQLLALERDLAAAAEIQRGLLPRDFAKLSARPALEVYGLMRPAREIGGDFYDAFFIGDNRLFFAVGDVSDKGIAAALFMARALTLLRTEALHAESPLVALRRVNAQLCEDNPKSMFVTLACGAIDLADGSVRLAHGGHPPPLRRGGAAAGFVPWPVGSVLGAMPALPLGESALRLAPGETLLLYSDGVTEARDGAGRMFGERRLLDAFGAAPGGAAAAVAAVDGVVASFAGAAAPSDDLTLLALCYRG